MNITHPSLSVFRPLLLSLAVLCFANQALAHVSLSQSTPAAAAQLAISPPELILEFEHPITLDELTLNNASGTAINFNFKASSNRGTSYKFPLTKLNTGHYVVNWTAVDRKGNKASDKFTFTVGAMAK